MKMPDSIKTKYCKQQVGEELNMLLDLVYDLNDASDGVSNDLEKIISDILQHVENMVDTNDALLGEWS